MLKLIIDSDLHFCDGKIRIDKTDHLAIIKEIHRTENVDAMICMGDLTESGTDGKSFLCWQYGGVDDQVTPLKMFVNKIENEYGIKIFLGEGNHDEYVPWPYLHKGVRNMIKARSKNNSTIYTESMWRQDRGEIEIYKYKFIFLGKYPSTKAVDFLSEELRTGLSDDNIIIGFHYNVEGDWSDWWSQNDKINFLHALEPYRKQIRLIVVGHRHENYLLSWHGYNVISGAGSRVVLCKIDPNNDFKPSMHEF